MKTKQITQFTAWDFLLDVQQAIIEGYRLSDANEHFPQVTVGLYTVTMVKVEQEKKSKEIEVKIEEIEETEETEETEKSSEEVETIGSKRGRGRKK